MNDTFANFKEANTDKVYYKILGKIDEFVDESIKDDVFGVIPAREMREVLKNKIMKAFVMDTYVPVPDVPDCE